MGSHCLTMSSSRLFCVLATCFLGTSAVSIAAPRTAILPLLTPSSIHSPQYRFQHLSPPVQFQPRLVCPSCSSADYCASCSCTSSLACRANCRECKGEPSASPPSSSCTASGGPAHGKPCVFPFIYQGVKYYGCAPLYGGLTNVYSPVYWCSTKVDINRFHIRGPYTQPGKYVGYCDDTCPRTQNFVF